MDADAIAELVRRINATPSRKGVIYVAGGGSEVFPMLLSQGGGSATLLGARILYGHEDFCDALGSMPERFVDARAARGLAMAAFRHALKVRGDLEPEHVFGIGATSKLATGEGEREGRSHEIHAALHMPLQTIAWSVTLPEGRDRAWEEHVNALILLNFIAFAKIVDGDYQIDYDGCERTGNPADFRYATGETPIADLFTGRRAWVSFDGPPVEYQGEYWWETENHEHPRLLLPGSFRPLHDGHIAMAEAASRLTGLPCAYELSIFHPEKLPLDYFAIRSRLKGFEPMKQCRLYLTNAPTYLDKARLFPGCTFVVGHDTAERIVDPRFYGGQAGRDAMLDQLERLGTRFLVFGRAGASGEFRDFTSAMFEHPVAGFLDRVATPVPGHVFRVDISSTEVRQRSDEEFP